MNRISGYSATTQAAALSIVLSCVLWSLSKSVESDSEAVVSGPEELREHLWRAQENALPSDDFPVFVEACDFIYAGNGRAAEVLAEGLVPVERADGDMRWPVTLYEDPLTFDTVFLNALGDEVFRLLPPEGYDPSWVFAAAFPEVRDGDGGEMSSYSPSRVIMTAGLLAPVDTEPLAVTSGEAGKEETGAGNVARPVADGQDSSAETAAADSVHDNTGDAGLQERVCASGDDGAVSSPPSAADEAPVGETVFVDSRSGNDLNTGRQPAAVTCDGGEQGEGPKKTIAAGLAAVKDGGRLAMTGGAYSENLDVRGRDVRVYIVGVVLLDKRVATGPGGVPEGG